LQMVLWTFSLRSVSNSSLVCLPVWCYRLTFLMGVSNVPSSCCIILWELPLPLTVFVPFYEYIYKIFKIKNKNKIIIYLISKSIRG
jgi:hypothetical protein